MHLSPARTHVRRLATDEGEEDSPLRFLSETVTETVPVISGRCMMVIDFRALRCIRLH